MSSIIRFFNQNFVISRLRVVSGNKKTFQSTATVEGHQQPLDERARQALGIVTSKAWYVWMDIDSPIKEGDKITASDGTDYKVQEINKYDYGANQHLEVLIVKWNV